VAQLAGALARYVPVSAMRVMATFRRLTCFRLEREPLAAINVLAISLYPVAGH
jgi:hypothetical protein